MNLRAFALALILLFALLASFAALNWAALSAPTAVSLGFAEISAPPGMILLAFTAATSGLLLVYIVLQQTAALLETRRFAKEVRAQRELADQAEGSRFTELKKLLEEGLRGAEVGRAEFERVISARAEQSDQGVQDRLLESTRTLSAYLGEIEDKLDRALAGAPP